MRSRVVDTVEGFRDLRTEWNALLERSRISSPFLLHEWLDAWWAEYAGERDRLRVVCYEDELTGALVGLLPTYVERSSRALPIRRLRFLGDALGATLLDCIVEPRAEVQVLAAMVDELCSDSQNWDVLDLRRLSEASPLMARLRERCAASGTAAAESVSVSCPKLALPSDWEEYLGTLSRRERGRVRRLRRELEAAGDVRIDWIDDPASLPGALDDVHRLFAESMSRKHDQPYSVPDRYRHFLASASEALLAHGWLRLVFLTVDGERIAFVYQMRHKDGMYAYQTAFDESWAPYHVGFVVFGHAIESAIREGCTSFNFGVGVGGYKLRFGPQIEELRGFRVYRRSYGGRMAAMRDGGARRTKELVKRLTPSGVRRRLETVVSWRGARDL